MGSSLLMITLIPFGLAATLANFQSYGDPDQSDIVAIPGLMLNAEHRADAIPGHMLCVLHTGTQKATPILPPVGPIGGLRRLV